MHSKFKLNRIHRFALGLCLAAVALVVVSHVTPLHAQEAPAPAAGAATTHAEPGKSAFGMVMEVAKTPPYVFFIIVACSIFTLTLIIERFMFYRKAGGDTTDMVDRI